MKKPINEIAKLKRIAGLITESEYQEEVMNTEAKSSVSKEDKIQVIKEWIWFTCDEGQAKDDINKYNKMVDMYFASKDDVTKEDFKNIWNKVIEKWGVGDVGADSEGFYDAWKDIQTGTLVNPGQTYESKEKVNEVYGFENDDLIYDNMVTMDIEQLVSDMLSTVEREPSTTLKNYLLKYDSSEDDSEGDYDTDYEEPNEPFDIAEAKGKTEDETWFSDVKYFKKEHEGYKLKPTDMVSIGDIPAMTYANAIKKFGLKEEFSDINERLEPHVYERMYNLSNIKAQQAMIRAAEILMRDLTEEGFEVPEIREFFTQLIANDI